MFKYRNYVAKIEPDIDTDMLHGRVLNIGDAVTGDIISFEGKTVKEAERAFHRSVDAYIEFCRRQGKEPDKPFSGKLPFRTTPEIHRDIYIAATRADKSINAWMEETLSRATQQFESHSVASSSSEEISFTEYRHLLALLEEKLNQLQAIVEPHLDQKPGRFDDFLGAIKPFLKDQELPALIEKIEVFNERLKLSMQAPGASVRSFIEKPSEAKASSTADSISF